MALLTLPNSARPHNATQAKYPALWESCVFDLGYEDRSAYGSELTFGPNAFFYDSAYGPALTSTGYGYVSLGGFPNWNPDEPFSMSMWINIDSDFSDGYTVWRIGSSTSREITFKLDEVSGLTQRHDWTGGDIIRTIDSTDFPRDEWFI